ncbi:MAG TPA: hypothetical protein VGY97_07650 [Solirubrobacteraceae bacterium]|jgi:hypothetical protein|nr:hypothetical protein [Solirubrobacteraceae bacterium]
MAQADDSRPAGRLLIELLPLQGLFVKRQLTYELEVEELGEFRVTISDGRASVEPRGSKEESGPGEVDFQLSGRIADLAPLVGGSPPRRLPGVRVTGRRRRLRHLLRRLRRPVALVDLARADVQPEPGLLLRAVVNGIDPAWTDGHEFSVVYAIEGAGDGEEERRFHVEVHRGEPVRVIEGTAERGGELEVSAALRVPRPALVALLAGLPLPAGQRAEVEGDGGRIVLLGEWIERAQRRSGGRR